MAKKNKNQNFNNQGTNNFKMAREMNPQVDPELASEFPTNAGQNGMNKKQPKQNNQ